MARPGGFATLTGKEVSVRFEADGPDTLPDIPDSAAPAEATPFGWVQQDITNVLLAFDRDFQI